jgi:hypothetical protein
MLAVSAAPLIGPDALAQARRVGEAAPQPVDAPSYVSPDGTATRVHGSPNQAGLNSPAGQGPDPNLSNLLGGGETTFLVDFQPSNFFVLAGGVGSRQTIRVTNNSNYPLLLKRWSLIPDPHLNFLVRVTRGDGRAIIGDGWLHAGQIAGVSVPLQLGPGIALERLADLRFDFYNLDAAAVTIGLDFEALKVANPEQSPTGKTLKQQLEQLTALYNKWQDWAGLNPQQRGLGAALYDFGRFYTFPLTQGVVQTDPDPHFQAVETVTGAPGTPFRGAFRNETGGVFVWQWIAFYSDFGGAPAPFTFDISSGAKSWKLTEGAVDSRLHQPAGVNVLGQWTPLWLPRPWIVKDQTTIVANISTPLGALVQPAVWFVAGGILIGGGVN